MRPQRVKGFSYRGLHRYLLTFCTQDRRQVFVDAAVVETARMQFQRAADNERFAILAYCLMPDHVHLVVEGLADESDLRRFVQIGKQRSAHAMWRNHELSKVWQEGYHDWVLRPDQSVTEKIRYVLDNPVRAGLVSRWDEYSFSGCIYPLE